MIRYYHAFRELFLNGFVYSYLSNKCFLLQGQPGIMGLPGPTGFTGRGIAGAKVNQGCITKVGVTFSNSNSFTSGFCQGEPGPQGPPGAVGDPGIGSPGSKVSSLPVYSSVILHSKVCEYN